MDNTIIYRKEVIFGTSMHDRLGVQGLFDRYSKVPEALGGRLVEDNSNIATGKYCTVWEFDSEDDAAVAVDLISGADIFCDVHKSTVKCFIVYWRDGKMEHMSGKTIAEAFTSAGYGAGALAAVSHYKEEDYPSYEWNRITKNWDEIDPVKELQIVRACLNPINSYEVGRLIEPLPLSEVVEAINAVGVKKPYQVEDFMPIDPIEQVGLYGLKIKNTKNTIKVWVVKG